jgi:hypothetical protein
MFLEVINCVMGVDILCKNSKSVLVHNKNGWDKAFPLQHEPNIAHKTTASLSSARDSTFDSRGKVFTCARSLAHGSRR